MVQVAATYLKQVVSIKVYSIITMANHLILAPRMEHFRQYLYSYNDLKLELRLQLRQSLEKK